MLLPVSFFGENTLPVGCSYLPLEKGRFVNCDDASSEWRLQQFPDEELSYFAATAWAAVAKVTYEVATRQGAEVVEPTIELGYPSREQFEIYNPAWIKEQLECAKGEIAQPA